MNSLRAQTWLILRNDLRLLWRDMLTGKLRLFSSITFIVVVFVFFQLMTLLLFMQMKKDPPLGVQTVVWAFFAFIMLSTAMNQAIAVLFQRADFDLLLSSPVSARAILLARCLTISVSAAAAVALFLVPILNAAVVMRSPWFGAGYIVWLLLAGIAAGGGTWFTLLLVRWLGAQRARTWTQILAGVIGAVIYLAFQANTLLPKNTRAALSAKLGRLIDNPAVAIPAKAARGDPLSLLVLTVIAALFAFLTLRLLSQLFVTGVQEAGGVKSRTVVRGTYRFVEGLERATFWKDVRLIARDPLLLSRVLPQTLYLLPMLLGFARGGKASLPVWLASFAVLLTLILSPQFTIVATAGEEGWDLIRMSGASTIRLRIAKIAASMALPLIACVLLVITVAALGRPGLALLALTMAVITTSSSCWLEVLVIRPSPRNDLIQMAGRRGGSFGATRLIVAIVQWSGGVGGVALAANNLWAWSALACGIATLTAVACFTLTTPRDPEFENAP